MSENRVFVFVLLEDYLCGISVHSKIDALRFYVFWVHNSSCSLLDFKQFKKNWIWTTHVCGQSSIQIWFILRSSIPYLLLVDINFICFIWYKTHKRWSFTVIISFDLTKLNWIWHNICSPNIVAMFQASYFMIMLSFNCI